MSEAIEVIATVERKDASLPRFVVVPNYVIADWVMTGTTTVDGTVANTPLGRRSLKRWDEARWFIDLPEPLCQRAEIDTGATVRLTLRRASTALPATLEALLADDAGARDAWSRLTPARQRVVSEHVHAAKQPATQVRRAHRWLENVKSRAGG